MLWPTNTQKLSQYPLLRKSSQSQQKQHHHRSVNLIHLEASQSNGGVMLQEVHIAVVKDDIIKILNGWFMGWEVEILQIVQ